MRPEACAVRFDQPQVAFLGLARLKELFPVQVVDVLVFY
jgi:hypothetical protein